jgi:pilus assembly protein Flp/PilA
MKTIKTSTQFLRSFFASEDGVTVIEYALLGALIVVVIMGSVALLGTRVLAMWTRISNCVSSATGGGGVCS